MSVYITSIGTANPKHRISQKEVLKFMQRAHRLNNGEESKLEALYRATGIRNRFSVLEDYKRTQNFDFFPNNDHLAPFPSTTDRAKLYKHHALALSKEAVENCLPDQFDKEQITHVITVSCTGLYAPGLDIELVNELGLNKSVQRTAINFMGCYAAFNAIKVAHSICSASESKVLVVCTELCSIHFQKENTEDNYLANALFGDGSAALLISSSKGDKLCLSLDSFYCDLLPAGKNEMAWEIGDHGFEMKLSAYVPDVIESGVTNLINRLKQAFDLNKFSYYAIHPGGRKILKVLEDALNISQEDNRHAYEVLRNYGNMSSPTVLFVLNAIFNELKSDDRGKEILSFAFGPGLTLESMTLTVH